MFRHLQVVLAASVNTVVIPLALAGVPISLEVLVFRQRPSTALRGIG